MADPLNFRFMDARLKNGVYPFAFLFSPPSSRFPLFPLCLPTPFFVSSPHAPSFAYPFSEIPPSLAYPPLPFLLLLPPALRLNNYPPFDDFALLLSYRILHMQIFIDRKNSEIKRFISSLDVSPSFTREREEKEIFFYSIYMPSKLVKFTISYLITFNIFFSLSCTFLIYFNRIFRSLLIAIIEDLFDIINIRFSGIFQSTYIYKSTFVIQWMQKKVSSFGV